MMRERSLGFLDACLAAALLVTGLCCGGGKGGGGSTGAQTVGTAPTGAAVITTDPADQTATVPAPATFTVVASGSPSPTFQWNLNAVPIFGATAASYTTPATSADMDGQSYTVTVSNGIGTPATSNAATLNLLYAPSISQDPASVTVASGAPATFSVVASGKPLPTCQWSRNGKAIPGATALFCSIPAATLAMSGDSYTAILTNGIGAPVSSAAGVLTVQQSPAIAVQPASATVIAPAAATFAVTATGNPLSYQWNLNGTAIDGATASSFTTAATSLDLNGGAYTVTVSGIGNPVTSRAAILTVDAAPAITTQPADQVVTAPAPATFTVAATGNPLAYQWQRNGAAIPGATSASYTTPATSLAMDGGAYSVAVSSGVGSPALSAAATLTVQQAPVITSQPGNLTVTAPAPATFTVAAAGNPLGYQWSLNGAAIPGATSASYTTPATSQAMSSGSYTVTVSGIGTPVTSVPAVLTVDAAPAITAQPAGASVTAPASATFTVAAAGAPLSYQWSRNGVAIPGATAASYTTPATSLAMDGDAYAVTVSGVGSPVTSAAAILTVDAAPVLSAQPGNQTVTAPSPATFTVAATGNPLVYQWNLNGAPIPGATASSYTTPASTLAMNGGAYTVTLSGTGAAVTSAAATLTVQQAPVITTQPGSQTVTAPAPATFTVAATGNPLAYQWSLNGTAIPGATSASYTTPATGLASNNGSYTVTVSGIGSPATSAAATLTVLAAPAITLQPLSQTTLAGSPVTFTVAASGNPAPSVQWNFNGVPISGATSWSYTVANPTLPLNNSSFTATVSNGTSVTSAAAILTVQQAPAIVTPPASQTVTAPASATFTVTASGNPLSYQWYLNGAAIPGATAASYTTPATALAANNGSYTVTVSGVGSPATSAAAALTVLAAPAFTLQPASVTVQPAATATFTAAANGNPAPTCQWSLNGVAIPGATGWSYTTPPGTFAMSYGSYTATASNGIGAAVTSAPAILTVNQVQSITGQPTNQTVTAPAPATFTVSTSGYPVSYQWNLFGTAIPGATSASYTTPASSLLMNGNAYTVTVTGAGAPVTSAPAVLTVNAAPVITTQPASLVVGAPVTATFTVSASGNPAPTCQWNLNGVAIPGATAWSYTTPATTLAMNGNGYTATVSNGLGGGVTSAVATLTVQQAPAITAQPGSQTVTVPATASFTVTATGNPLNYQWNLNGTAIPGATSASYTTPASTLLMNGYAYTVTVSGTGAPATSTAATLTVDGPPAITVQPASVTVKVPASATFTVAASGNPAPTCQWYLNGTAIPGATGLSYTTPATSLAMDGGSYSATLGNGVGSSVTSAPAVLSVDQAAAITTQPASQTAIAPAAATFTVAATGNPLTYQWNLNGAAIPGATSASYTTPASTLLMNGNAYTVAVTGAGNTVVSAAATLTVDAAPTITLQPVGVTVNAPATATFTVAASGNPVPTCQWNLNGVPIAGATGWSYTTPAASFAMNNNSYTATVGNGIGTPVTSAPALLQVLQAAAITAQPASVAVTAPATATFTVAATGYPLTYQWYRNGAALPGANAASYTTPATTLAMDQGSYTVSVGGTGTPVTSAAAILTVNLAPAITVQPVSATVNTQASATFTVTATGNPAPSFQWNLNGSPIAGARAAAYTTPAATLAMNGGGYTVTVTNGIGSGVTSAVATLTVDQAPAITAQPAALTVVSPATATFTVTATGNPLAYQWYLNNVALPGATQASYTTPATTLAMNNGSYTVTVSGSGSPATSAPALLTVQVAPAITTQPVAQTLTLGSPINLSVVATGNPQPTYQWSCNGTPLSGATGASLAIASATSANAGTYQVTVSNGVGSPAVSNPVLVSMLYQLTGTVVSDLDGNPLAGVTVTLDPAGSQQAVTDASGSFAFTVGNGSYTLTPAISGPTSAFHPAALTAVVNGANLAVAFRGTLGYSVSGQISYAGALTGPVVICLESAAGGGPSLETSLVCSCLTGAAAAFPASFTLRGVPPGNYTLHAYLASYGLGEANAGDPVATPVPVAVTNDDRTDLAATMADASVSLASQPGPAQLVVSPMDSGLACSYQPITGGGGVDLADHYLLEWAQVADFSSISGSHAFTASGSRLHFLSNQSTLVNGTAYYFRMRGLAGTTASANATLASPVTIGPTTGANTVSGTVTLGSAATGPLYVGLLDPGSNQVWAVSIQAPASTQPYSISGVPAGSGYQLFSLLDQDGDGLAGPGDEATPGGAALATLAVAGDVTQNLTLSAASASAQVTTTHLLAGGLDRYLLQFQLADGVKHLTSAMLVSGAGVVTPMDLGLEADGTYRLEAGTGTDRPAVGTTYLFQVGYSDNTVDLLSATVTGVLDALPQNLAPQGTGDGSGSAADLQPAFTWQAPGTAPADAYGYAFWLAPHGSGSTVWQVPGLANTALSLAWGTDPGNAANLPVPASLTVGTSYDWWVAVIDASGNQAMTQASYTP